MARKEKTGHVEPNNLTITELQREKVAKLMLREDGYLARYIRYDDGQMFGTNVRMGRHPLYYYGLGTPVGVLVALKEGGKVRVGWSKYHEEKEKVPFNKRGAKRCALLRAVAEDIILDGSTNDDGTPKVMMNLDKSTIIPKTVREELDSFIMRVHRYYFKKRCGCGCKCDEENKEDDR